MFFFLQAFFKHVVIHGLSGLLFFLLPCVMLLVLTGQLVLNKFVNMFTNLLYVILTSSSANISSQLQFSKSFMRAFFATSLITLFFMQVLFNVSL